MSKTNDKKEKPQSQQGFKGTLFEVSQEADRLSEETIKKAIETHPFKKWAYILHDKDEYTREDEERNPAHEEGKLKRPHWHVFLSTEESYHAGNVAQWFEIETQYIQKVTSGRFNTAALYCVHAHDKTKYQYDPAEVKANFDYVALVKRDAEKVDSAARKKAIIDGIMNGTIREYNMHKAITAEEFTIYKSVIENTFEYRRRAIADTNADRQVIFIQGDAGVGKTAYAKKLANDKGLSKIVAGATNDPLEDYRGQDVLILDDLRGSSQRLEDLLKMLDNNTNSMAKSRYHNKVLECKLIIITSSQDINTFFNHAFQDNPENITQLKRRCQTYMQMTRDDIIVSMYDEKLRDYLPCAHVENPIKDAHPVEELTAEKIQERLHFLFGDNIKKIEAPTDNKAAEASTPLNNNIISQYDGAFNNPPGDCSEYFM